MVFAANFRTRIRVRTDVDPVKARELEGMRLLAFVLVAVAAASSASAPGATGAGAEWVAFAGVRWSSNSVTASIYTMRADGTQRRRLTNTGNWTDTNPDWSRDGRRVAFGRMDSRGWRVMVMSADGHRLHAVTGHRPLADAPTWSPSGRAIAFAGLPAKLPMHGSFAQQIYIVSIPSGHVRQLTPSAPFPGGARLPAWSRDGRRIAFAARTSSADNARSDIWTIRPNGTGRRRLVRDGDAPAWSPDGRRLAFARDGDIYVLTLASRAVKRVTRTPRAGDGDPSWCSNGDHIAYSTVHRAADPSKDDMAITVARADGSGTRTIRDYNPSFWADSPAFKP
jgi:Tol biopolymer transport system component